MNLTHTPAWAKGMRKIGPGMYVDARGALHVSDRELCEYFGVPYTPKNARLIDEVVMDAVRGEFPGARRQGGLK